MGKIRRERKRLTITPRILVAVETSPCPVPLYLAGKISGEMAYKTPYMIYMTSTISLPQHILPRKEARTLLKKVYPQFHPNHAFDVLAVVLAKRKADPKRGKHFDECVLCLALLRGRVTKGIDLCPFRLAKNGRQSVPMFSALTR